MHDALAFVANSCRQSVAVTRERWYEARRSADTFELVADGAVFGSATDPVVIRGEVYMQMHGDVLRAMASDGWTRLHGGLVDIHGRRVLVTGPGRAGKTTLCVRLLFDGADVGSDEYTMAHGGDAAAYPRRLHVRERTAHVVSELRPLLASIPSHDDDTVPDERGPVHALDPTDLGFAWSTAFRPVDAIFFLNPNHGGRTSLTSTPKHRMAMLLSSQAFTTVDDSATVVAQVSAIVGGAQCFELEIGSPEAAAALIRNA